MARQYGIENLYDSGMHCLLFDPYCCYSYLVVFLFPYSYHKLLVAKYRNKQEKTQEAKWRSAIEQRLVHKLERAMDVDLFLEIRENRPRTALTT